MIKKETKKDAASLELLDYRLNKLEASTEISRNSPVGNSKIKDS